MAERRMFAKTVIDSDAFLDMPLSAHALYFHLSMRADDDGFINNPKKIQRMIGASDDDCKLLIMKQFIIPFESGIVVIKHWKIHNYIRSDRYKPTLYQDEKNQLTQNENKAYTEKIDVGIPTVTQRGTQDRLGEVSLELGEDRDNMMCNSPELPSTPPKPSKPVKHKYGEYKNVLLTDEELQKLKTEYSDYEDRIERLSSYIASKGTKYKSHYATIRNWARKDKETKPQQQQPTNKFLSQQSLKQKPPGERREPTFDVSEFTKKALDLKYVPPEDD